MKNLLIVLAMTVSIGMTAQTSYTLSRPSFPLPTRAASDLNPKYFSDTKSEVYPYLVHFKYEGNEKMLLYSYYGEIYLMESSHSIHVYSKVDLVSKYKYDEAMLEDARTFHDIYGQHPNTDLKPHRSALRSIRERKQNQSN